MTHEDKPCQAFAIAGADQKWHWATADFQGDSITLSSDQVQEPVAVRYAWAMNPSQRNLIYNKEGIPASPFRTDDWPLYEKGSEEVQVNKPKGEKQKKDWDRPAMLQ
jgi:sialate O-acetylesterase